MPSGFCFFNNVAIAAQHALDNLLYKRILILDWDVHHGNGIQNAFLSDDRVLYISLHLYLRGQFYPGGPGGGIKIVGEGNAEGKNVNIPWDKQRMGDSEYLHAFFSSVLPICYEFDPELVFVSAGFDAAEGDPLGMCRVSPSCYGIMTNLLMPLAEGKIILALEGGYNLASISRAMGLCAKALLGDPADIPKMTRPDATAAQVLSDVARVHSDFWKLAFKHPTREDYTRLKEATKEMEAKAKEAKEKELSDKFAGISLTEESASPVKSLEQLCTRFSKQILSEGIRRAVKRKTQDQEIAESELSPCGE